MNENKNIIDRINEIENKLKATTGKSHWKVLEAGGDVLYPCLSTKEKPYYTKAEDNCIVDDNGVEILGCSEWLRVEKEDLSFMADSKSDVEFLLFELRKLLGE